MVLAITWLSTGNAQTIGELINQKKFDIGVKVGYNYSNLSFSSETYEYNTNGFHGYYLGLFVEYELIDMLSIQPEIVYSTQGNFNSVVTNRGLIAYEIEKHSELNYLNIPIMLKLHLVKNEDNKKSVFSIDFGPQLGFLRSVEIRDTDYMLNNGSKIKGYENLSDKKSVFNSVDFGLGIGATYKFESVKGLAISARYNYGLSNISKSDTKWKEVDLSDSKNRVIQVGLSYQL